MTQRSAPHEARRGYNHPCLIAQALDVLGDRWTLLILRDLMGGLTRYNDILENCGGMSPNVLSDRLKRLEADGLVCRSYQKALPPRVEYTLTDKGWSVRPILVALLEWGREQFGGLSPEDVGAEVSQDFAIRMLPTFSFHPERACGIEATMTLEIVDSDTCNTWSFAIHEGHLHPRRRPSGGADVYLKTDTLGFFQFIRGEARPEHCGQLSGSVDLATAIQACFVSA